MKRIIIALFVFMTMVGCNIFNNDKNNGTVNDDTTCESSNFQNVKTSIEIVEKPIYGVVTNQIAKTFIGRYNVQDPASKDKGLVKVDKEFYTFSFSPDPEPLYPDEYFEIREDGTYSLSMFNVNRNEYVTYTEREMELVAYYNRGKYCQIEFRLKSGIENKAFSVPFEIYSNDGCGESWNGIFDGPYFEYAKTNDYFSDSSKEETECKDYSTIRSTEGPIEIVDMPEYGITTKQIAKSIVGKYSIKNRPKSYFKIKEDGTFVFSEYDRFKGKYIKHTEKDLDLVAFYEKDKTCTLFFWVKVGSEKLFSKDSERLSRECISLVGDATSIETVGKFSCDDFTYQKEK